MRHRHRSCYKEHPGGCSFATDRFCTLLSRLARYRYRSHRRSGLSAGIQSEEMANYASADDRTLLETILA